MLVEVIAHTSLQKSNVGNHTRVGCSYCGVTHALYKLKDRFCRIPASAQRTQGRHARIIPAVYKILFHQSSKLALAHHGVVQVETSKLNLAWLEHPQLFRKPLIEWTMIAIF